MPSANLTGATHNAAQAARFALIAIWSVTYSVAILVGLHLLRSGYNPVSQPMSNYLVGPFGFLMTTVLVALAMSMFALALALFRGMAPSHPSRTGLMFLGAAGCGAIIAAIFPADVNHDGTFTLTPSGIHALASFVSSPCFVGATLALSKGFHKDKRFKSLGHPASELAVGCLASYVFVFGINTLRLPIGGISQRVFAALAMSWIFVVATRLRSGVSGVHAP